MMLALALGMVVVAMVLLSVERIPLEIASVAIIVLLVLTGLVGADEALASISSETPVFLFALLALTRGLSATGVMQLAGRRMVALSGMNRRVLAAALLVVVAAFSSVASNTAVTAAFLPVAIAVAAQVKLPASKLLMPMAFASMLGGTITLFGSSTNLVVSAAMADLGLARIGFLELAPLGLPIAAIGITLTLVFVWKLLPSRVPAPEEEDLVRRAYLTEAVLTPRSRLVGKPLRHLTEGIGVPVRGLVRAGRLFRAEPDEVLLPDDHLIVAGSLEDLLRVKDLRSVGLRADIRYAPAEARTLELVEVSVPPSSGLVGKTIRELRFADRHGILVLGLHRHPTMLHHEEEPPEGGALTSTQAVRDVRLAVGDVLLVSGTQRRLRDLARDEDLTVLGSVEYHPPRYRRAAAAVIIFTLTVVVAGLRWTSPAIAGLAGVLAMVAAGCVRPREALRVDWRVVLMIGALLTLGRAMEKTGAGAFIAQGLLPVAELGGAQALLVALMVLTIVLSVPMSNQAAALIMLPIGVHAASTLGLSPRTFAMGVCFAASCSFLTPLEPSAALVFGPGRYRFSDFFRVGGPLTVVVLILLSIAVPIVWPFKAP